MSRHLSLCTNYRKVSGKLSTSIDSKSFQHHETKADISTDDVVDKVLNFFVSENIAFMQVDNPEFQELVSIVKIDGKTPSISRKSIHKRLNFHAQKAK